MRLEGFGNLVGHFWGEGFSLVPVGMLSSHWTWGSFNFFAYRFYDRLLVSLLPLLALLSFSFPTTSYFLIRRCITLCDELSPLLEADDSMS